MHLILQFGKEKDYFIAYSNYWFNLILAKFRNLQILVPFKKDYLLSSEDSLGLRFRRTLYSQEPRLS